PMIALPGRARRIRPNGLAERSRLDGVYQRLGVRPCRKPAPDQLAVLDVVGAYPAANAKFAARNTNQHLVLEHERSVGAGLALAGLAVHHGPDDFSGLGVQRDKRRIGLIQENLAIGIGDTT